MGVVPLIVEQAAYLYNCHHLKYTMMVNAKGAKLFAVQICHGEAFRAPSDRIM